MNVYVSKLSRFASITKLSSLKLQPMERAVSAANEKEQKTLFE